MSPECRVAGDAWQPREGQEHVDNNEGEAEGGEQGAGGDALEPRGAAAEVQPGQCRQDQDLIPRSHSLAI